MAKRRLKDRLLDLWQRLTGGAVYEEDPIHNWFGLSYASYLVLPRTLLQSLPKETQQRLVDALNEIGDLTDDRDWLEGNHYDVQVRKKDGRLGGLDPLRDYQRGRRHIDLKTLTDL